MSYNFANLTDVLVAYIALVQSVALAHQIGFTIELACAVGAVAFVCGVYAVVHRLCYTRSPISISAGMSV